MSLLEELLNALIPRACLVCARPLRRNLVCRRCIPDINIQAFDFSLHPALPLKRLCSLWIYGRRARAYIRAMKYRPSIELARTAGQIMRSAFTSREELRDIQLIVCIPSSQSHFLRRLFNPAAVLAKQLSEAAKIPFSSRAIIHHGYRKPQAWLHGKQRFANVRKTFSANSRIVCEKNILLVDDVITTSATIGAAAKALRDAGARSVTVATLARNDRWMSYLNRMSEEFGRSD